MLRCSHCGAVCCPGADAASARRVLHRCGRRCELDVQHVAHVDIHLCRAVVVRQLLQQLERDLQHRFRCRWRARTYDYIGLRVEAEGVYRENTGTLAVGGFSAGFNFNEVAIMGNAYYDFLAGSAIVPYIGAGAGVAFLNAGALGATAQSTQFAYQGILGVGWNINPMFRLNLEGRYYGTTAPNFSNQGSLGGTQYNLTYSPQNNNVSAMLSLHIRFGVAAPPPPPPPPPVVSPPSFMVFFDWDRSNLSQQALTTIQQAANAFQAKGNARITATGHTDTSGPESYNMAAVAASCQHDRGCPGA